MTGRDARRMRPHQTAYSIGKRVNEGHTDAVRPYLPSESSPLKENALVIEKQSYFILPLQVETIGVSLFEFSEVLRKLFGRK